MAGNSTDAGRSVTSKVTAILMVFDDGDVHTLTEIAASADLLTSTAHHLASELVAWRLLERTEERSYRIGLPLRIIASEYCESEVCSTTQTVMRALVPYSAWLARLRLILSPKLQCKSGRPALGSSRPNPKMMVTCRRVRARGGYRSALVGG